MAPQKGPGAPISKRHRAMRMEGGGRQMLADIIACGIAAGAFAALGILLVNGKCLTLVTAYFAATPKQREAYDKVALGRFAGGLMFFFAGCVSLLRQELYSTSGGSARQSLCLRSAGACRRLSMRIRVTGSGDTSPGINHRYRQARGTPEQATSAERGGSPWFRSRKRLIS